MIRHIVLLKFRASTTQTQKLMLYGRLQSLCANLEGTTDFRAGPNTSSEGFSQGFADGFTIDFTNETARNAYLTDETHRTIGTDLVAMLENGTDGLMVFDLED